MTRLRIVVLGSAAGGGVPQWNCLCRVCTMAWAGDPRVRHRTQSSLCVSAGGERWSVVNCAAEIGAQIKACPTLHPAAAEGVRRGSPIQSVLLTNGDIDHVAGLLTLREGQAFALYATAEIHEVILENPIFRALGEHVVRRWSCDLDLPFELVDGVEARLFSVPGKVPLYMEGADVDVGAEGGMTVGVELSAGGGSAFYIPGCARMTASLMERLWGAAAVLFDGTVWSDEELVVEGVGTKTGTRMGHMPISGPEGSLAALADVEVGRRIYVHINNTNPILVEDSPERRAVERAGWEVAYDGMEIGI